MGGKTFGTTLVHMRPYTFLYRIRCSTTIIGTIFGFNAYFWQRRTPKWIYFPIFEHNTSKITIFRTPVSTLGGDRHWRPLTLLYRIQCSITFIVSIFGYNTYFSSVEPQSKSTTSFLYIIIFHRWQSLAPSSSTPGVIDICAYWLVQNSVANNITNVTRVFLFRLYTNFPPNRL